MSRKKQPGDVRSAPPTVASRRSSGAGEKPSEAHAIPRDADAVLRDIAALLKEVKGSPERFLAIAGLTDEYCVRELRPLGTEYRDMCRLMAAQLCQKGSPVAEGKSTAQGWAAAIVAAVGFVNFLGDKDFPPTRTMAQVAAGFGVSESGLAAKSAKIRRMLDLGQFHPEWTLPSLLDCNPFAWMLETTTGILVDARQLPREQQAKAFDAGLIPYIPADRAAEKPRQPRHERPGDRAR